MSDVHPELADLEARGADLAELRALASDRGALADRLRALGLTKIGPRQRVANLLAGPAASQAAAPAAAPVPRGGRSVGETLGVLPARLATSHAASMVSRCEVDKGDLPFFGTYTTPGKQLGARLGVAEGFPNVTQIRADPPLYICEGFVSDAECDKLVRLADPLLLRSKTDGGVTSTRTSRSCHLSRQVSPAPELMRRAAALTGKPTGHMEDPQVARYEEGQFYKPHFDSGGTGNGTGSAFHEEGGQRVGTILIYLNEVRRGGGTRFPKLGMEVSPRKGAAVVFFPCDLDGTLDVQLLHEALPAVDRKYVCQLWIRERELPPPPDTSSVGLGHRLLDALYST